MIKKFGLNRVAQNLGITKKNAPAKAEKASEQSTQATQTESASISDAAKADQPASAKTIAVSGLLASAAGFGLMAAAPAVAPLAAIGLTAFMVGGVVGGIGVKEMITDAITGRNKGPENVAESGGKSVQAMNGDTQKPLVMLDEPKNPS